MFWHSGARFGRQNQKGRNKIAPQHIGTTPNNRSIAPRESRTGVVAEDEQLCLGLDFEKRNSKLGIDLSADVVHAAIEHGARVFTLKDSVDTEIDHVLSESIAGRDSWFGLGSGNLFDDRRARRRVRRQDVLRASGRSWRGSRGQGRGWFIEQPGRTSGAFTLFDSRDGIASLGNGLACGRLGVLD